MNINYKVIYAHILKRSEADLQYYGRVFKIDPYSLDFKKLKDKY